MYIYCCPKCHVTIVNKTDDGRKFAWAVTAHKKYHKTSMSYVTPAHMSSEYLNTIKWGLEDK